MLTAGALLAFVTTGNAGIMGAARYPVALARDGLMLKLLAKTSGSRAIPVPALLFTSGVMCLLQFLPIEQLVSVSSTLVMLSYVINNLSVLLMRESGVLNYRPTFRTPLYPIPPIMCIMLFSMMIMRLGDYALNTVFLLIFVSVIMCFSTAGMSRKRPP